MPLTGRRRQDDRGAISMLAAILFASGVLLGMAALVIDVGMLYAERGQLQSGADAAAVEVAQMCADDPNDCTPAALQPVAARYARDNAANGEADARVCGRGGSLAPCAAPAGALTDCIGNRPASADYVEVRTNTLRGGSTVLPPVFAQALLGGDFEGAQVTACARTAWGPPSTAQGLALTISSCDWLRITNAGATLPSVEVSIELYDESAPTSCGIGGTAPTNPGGFRWLSTGDSACRDTLSRSDEYTAVLPGPAPGGCVNALDELLDSGDAIAVPIFDAARNLGGGRSAHTVVGFAAFVVTGWQDPSSMNPSPAIPPCATPACVQGYFKEALVPGGAVLGGPDLGARAIATIG